MEAYFLLLSIIISCICHRKGCCKRNGGRQRIYNDNRNEEQQDLTTVDNLNSLSIDMSNLPTSSTKLQITNGSVPSGSAPSGSKQYSAQTIQKFISDLQEQKRKGTEASKELEKKIKTATAALQKVQKNHPASLIVNHKRK